MEQIEQHEISEQLDSQPGGSSKSLERPQERRHKQYDVSFPDSTCLNLRKAKQQFEIHQLTTFRQLTKALAAEISVGVDPFDLGSRTIGESRDTGSRPDPSDQPNPNDRPATSNQLDPNIIEAQIRL